MSRYRLALIAALTVAGISATACSDTTAPEPAALDPQLSETQGSNNKVTYKPSFSETQGGNN
jgi:hypothetical protein